MSTSIPYPGATKRGSTPNELAKVLRVSPDKVRSWIKSGQLGAIDTSPTRCGKPRYVVLPHHLEEFEQRRQAITPAKVVPRRRRPAGMKDYYPDEPAAPQAGKGVAR